MKLWIILAARVSFALASKCGGGQYWDDVINGCKPCAEICNPIRETLAQCVRTEECKDFLVEGLRCIFSQEHLQIPADPRPSGSSQAPLHYDDDMLLPVGPVEGLPHNEKMGLIGVESGILGLLFGALITWLAIKRRNRLERKQHEKMPRTSNTRNSIPSGIEPF